MQNKKVTVILIIVAVLLLASIALNIWLWLENSKQSETTEPPANNNCKGFDPGDNYDQCYSNCMAADCDIEYSSGMHWCDMWCDRRF